MCGYHIPVNDDRLAAALAKLLREKHDVILLSYFMDMSDREIGELLDIDSAVNKLGEKLQKRFSGSRVTEGFVTGLLVFAVGALAVMGPLESGLQHQHGLLFSKSVIDGVASIVFASTMGLGVALSGITVFVVEGSIALLASVVAPYLGEAVVNEITFVGSLLIVGISLNLLGLTKLRILNMVPAILLPILLCRFMG